jgi:hypothetical protein
LQSEISEKQHFRQVQYRPHARPQNFAKSLRAARPPARIAHQVHRSCGGDFTKTDERSGAIATPFGVCKWDCRDFG